MTHKEEALNPPGTPERLAIMTDLKYAPHENRPPLSTDKALTQSFPRPGAKNLQENERVRFWDYTWSPGATVRAACARYRHDRSLRRGRRDYVDHPHGKTVKYQAARRGARFVPRGTVDSEVATSGSPRAIVVELK